jgi:transcription antitermination factor NusB
MKVKEKGREIAFKLLFAIDVGKNSLPDAASFFRHEYPVVVDYAMLLVNGTLSHIEYIDKKIEGLLENWSFERVYVVDKELLRLGFFEIEFVTDIDNGLVVYEIVELAKKYGDKESGNFVNGVLRNFIRQKENEKAGS